MECRINEKRVYYKDYGEGIPLLCLHGYAVEHKVLSHRLEPIFEAMPGYRRIYPDLPGMGRSSVSDAIQNADDMLDFLLEFIDQTIGSQEFLLAGESYGGYLALGLLKEIPQRLKGLLLVAPCVIPDSADRQLPPRQAVEKDKAFIEEIIGGDIADYLETAVVISGQTYRRYAEEILPGLKMSNKEFVEHYRDTGYAFSFNEQLKELHFDKPACMITGKQDHIVGYEDQWMFNKNFPRASFFLMDGAGHNLQLERPELFRAIVADWISRTEYRE